MRLTLIVLGVLVAGLVASRRPTRRDNPLLSAAALDDQFTGVVTERLLAGSYAYLHVHDEAGSERWVVTLAALAPVGRAVDVRVFAQKETFVSPRLGRSFSPLLFGSVTERVAGHAAQP
jgi:hypothetical protein